MRQDNEITEIIIHCSASNSPEYDRDAIERDHVENRGWMDIGYHYVIDFDGLVATGRSLYRKGAHCYGQNTHSIGICVLGLDNFNSKQGLELLRLVKRLCDRFPIKSIKPHSAYSDKTCPNMDIKFVEYFMETFGENNE